MGIYALLKDAKWINNPLTTRLAHRKLLQLRAASKAGFRTPRTVVTNNPAVALQFADTIGADMAIKSLGALHVTEDTPGAALQYGLFTRRITRQELLEAEDKVCHMPTLFQEFIPKMRELRITCVGTQMFTCCIEPHRGDETADDHRFEIAKLNHFAGECSAIRRQLQEYLKFFGLNFACFDVIIPESGDPVFLEANPNGQWLWCEEMADLPISEAVARELMS